MIGFASSFEKNRGSAIILTLFLVSLLVVLILAVFGASTRTLKSAARESHQSRAERLGEMAASIAVGQLRKATNQTRNDRPLPWTSQPGAVRTYTQDGNPYRLFKLYSAANMVSTPADPGPETDVPVDWRTR
ncbi:MAG: hypothetical protein AAF514_15210, partial [Verrucomicrobiota bacterium]